MSNFEITISNADSKTIVIDNKGDFIEAVTIDGTEKVELYFKNGGWSYFDEFAELRGGEFENAYEAAENVWDVLETDFEAEN